MKHAASIKVEVNSVQDTSKFSYNHSETNADILDSSSGSRYLLMSVALVMYAITRRIKA